ncbi:hypothetical protein [Oceanihabitans sediminis]|uniref:hypothetical protein n=1 Tax=Oceanihabitans sediminis TaxID=1812012 RepID=UPI003A9188EB
MKFFISLKKSENLNDLDNHVVIKYFDIILLSNKDDNFFDFYDSLVPNYLNVETSTEKNTYCNLKDKIVDFAKNENYMNVFNNGYCKLTEKGKLAKKKGGHYKFIKFRTKKDKSENKFKLTSPWIIMITALLLGLILETDRLKKVINNIIDNL